MYKLTEPQKLAYSPYKGVKDCPKIGGTNKANRVIKTALSIEQIEKEFFNISFKANRSDKQRDKRRNKR